MGEGPLISVIVPIYNVEKYIYKSIESVRNQTYQNLEIILVDDGSQDNCGRIADEFAQKDKRIKVIHKENGGLSDARNAGLRIASGLYIYFFDSDDLMTSNLIETALSVYMRTDTDLVCFNYIVYDEITGREKKTSFPVQSCKIRGRKTNLVTAEYLGYRLGYCVWNKLYRADIIKKNRIFFVDNSQIFAEDICFNLYYISFCKRIEMIQECLYNYLNRENSIMGKSKKEPRLNQFIMISKCYEEFLEERGKSGILTQCRGVVFSILMRLQLGKVGRLEREQWIEQIEDKAYFYRNSDEAVSQISNWLHSFGLFKGLKEWLKAIEYYYGKKLWIFFIKRIIFRLKQK